MLRAELATRCADVLSGWIAGAPGYSLEGQDREVFAAAGIAAGLAYWAMAGRRAGAWRAARPRPQTAAG